MPLNAGPWDGGGGGGEAEGPLAACWLLLYMPLDPSPKALPLGKKPGYDTNVVDEGVDGPKEGVGLAVYAVARKDDAATLLFAV